MTNKNRIVFFGDEVEMTKEELEMFFAKYNLLGLESFNIIFENVKDFDLTEVRKIHEREYDKQYEKDMDELLPFARHSRFKVTDLKRQKVELTDKELQFLLELVSSSVMYIEAKRDMYNDYNGDKSELGFEVGPNLREMQDLEEYLDDEIEDRKTPKQNIKK